MTSRIVKKMKVEIDGIFDYIEDAIVYFEMEKDIQIFPHRLELALYIENYLKDKLCTKTER